MIKALDKNLFLDIGEWNLLWSLIAIHEYYNEECVYAYLILRNTLNHTGYLILEGLNSCLRMRNGFLV